MMSSSPFWFSSACQERKTYADLLVTLDNLSTAPAVMGNGTAYETFVQLLCVMGNGGSAVLIDPALKMDQSSLPGAGRNIDNRWRPKDVSELLERIRRAPWKLTLFSSGTTGSPKQTVHTAETLFANIRTGEKHAAAVWGLCYNPTHIAGLLVFFQALFTKGSLVYCFGSPMEVVAKLLVSERVTCLSATPSYYRLLCPKIESGVTTVEHVTFGGERLSVGTLTAAKIAFPRARFHNVFAATEIGSLLVSDGVYFRIPPHQSHRVKVTESELFFLRDGAWVSTGDLVQVQADGSFEILGRQQEVQNIGGYLANPVEVERALLNLPSVSDAMVVPRKNSVTGVLFEAHVVLKSAIPPERAELELTAALATVLPKWMIPRKFVFLQSIELGRTGKRKKQ